MTGRVVITAGTLIFFGNEYDGEPRGHLVLQRLHIRNRSRNVSLETKVQSIDVVLTLTGPMDNLKLSYRHA